MLRYDIVIVGSGLGGLACGTILAKEGYKVCLLEKNKQIGGQLIRHHALLRPDLLADVA